MRPSFKSIVATGFMALAGLSTSATELAVLRNGFTIRHERRESRESVTRLYFVNTSDSYVEVPTEEIVGFESEILPEPPVSAPAPSRPLGDVVSLASIRNNVDPELVMILIRAESAFHANAVSPKGAQGLMQLMPQTAARLGVQNPLDPVANVEGGTRYLRQLLDRYGNDLIKALAAYNAGPERVDEYRGVPPYAETRAYVAKIVGDFNRQKHGEYRNKREGLRTAKAPAPTSLPQPSSASTMQ
jgi:hypothetical protein